MKAILFGSIGTLADASEMQRQAFNTAFAEHGLHWNWDRETYQAMLVHSGGAARIAAVAQEMGVTVDAEAIHASKSSRFHDLLISEGLTPRPGAPETIAEARGSGLSIALVTTTSAANVSAVFGALEPQVSRADFDLIVDVSQVRSAKPAPDAYVHAMAALARDPDECVAIEDNVGGLDAAAAAGLTCAAFPNSNTAGHDFGTAVVLERLDLGALRALATA